MQIKELMKTDLETVPVTATLRQAAEKLSHRNIGMLPVLDGNSKLVGTITDRDIVVNGTAKSLAPDSTSLEKVMSPNVVTCAQDTELKKAAELMRKNQIRRLVVTDGERPVGIVSLGDVANRCGDPELVHETLKDVS